MAAFLLSSARPQQHNPGFALFFWGGVSVAVFVDAFIELLLLLQCTVAPAAAAAVLLGPSLKRMDSDNRNTLHLFEHAAAASYTLSVAAKLRATTKNTSEATAPAVHSRSCSETNKIQERRGGE